MQNTARADNGVWIDVDTAEQTLLVMQGDSVKAVFENVAIGRYGTTWSKVTKDDKTPLGRFRVGWVNEKSRYYRFFGLNYPNLDTANRALEENRIDEETWLSIKQAKSRGRTPPQDTLLGGHIGIHGIGTVSYTHLDVYKRQEYHLLRLQAPSWFGKGKRPAADP